MRNKKGKSDASVLLCLPSWAGGAALRDLCRTNSDFYILTILLAAMLSLHAAASIIVNCGLVVVE